MSCEHDYTYEDEDYFGKRYLICEECGEEVEPVDTRSFYYDPDTGKVTW